MITTREAAVLVASRAITQEKNMADDKIKNVMVQRGFFANAERFVPGDVLAPNEIGASLRGEMLGSKHVVETDAKPKRMDRDKLRNKAEALPK
jgi:hypothetical protein